MTEEWKQRALDHWDLINRLAKLVNQLAQGQEQRHVCTEIKRILGEKISD